MRLVAVGELVHEKNHVEDEELAARCAATTILITAAVAADMERLARRIHEVSAGAASPFVRVSAAALPITAAMLTKTCASLLEAATGGSLLLTDVEDMPAIVQYRLIDTLVELQSAREPSAAVRLIAGTTTSLCQRIADGTFSERLFYRLNLIHIVAKNAAENDSPREIA
jgi:DNA-binding NtrC family response regulator